MVGSGVQELEALDEPKKKEIADLRKKIELVDRELRPLKASCERKVTKKEGVYPGVGLGLGLTASSS